jgi:DNA adenine methylase
MIDKIRLIALYKDRIKVSNADGIDIIKKYSKDERSFFYIDPPYFVKGADLYLNAFKLKDHKKLAGVLRARADVKWLLTYDNEATIRELYSGLEQEPFDLRYSAHLNSRLGSEVMIFSNAIDTHLLNNE